MRTESTQQLLRDIAHRPYPLPSRAWLGHQSWYNLLLAHWPVRPEALRSRIPEPLKLETHDGVAWVTIVPFRMQDVRLRGIPRSLGMTFPELNVRTYVRHNERSGVYFLSLDATSAAAVFLGRRLFGLPYFRARISTERNGARFQFESARAGGIASFSVSYEGGSPIEARPGSLDAWLMERYCFYSKRGNRGVQRCDVHHRPWPLQEAMAVISRNGLSETPP